MKWINVKIDGYDTQYIISENGIVINLNTGREIKKTLVDGYMRSKFIIGDKYRYKNLALVMMESFYNKTRGNDEVLYFKDKKEKLLWNTTKKYIEV